VAVGTVRNHFPTIDDLAEDVAAYVLAELRMPTSETFAGLDDVRSRVVALAGAMAGYYERSQPWYRMDQLDERPIQAWAEARARYEADLDALIREALGPSDADDESVAVVTALIGPGVFGVLLRRQEGFGDAADLIADVLAAWLASRRTTGGADRTMPRVRRSRAARSSGKPAR
jgi:AcrR family transcriptional regulator